VRSKDSPEEMGMADDKHEILNRLDPDRRDFLKKVMVAAAFTVPTVTSFSMDGLSVYQAHALNGSNLPPDSGTKN
jgi:hypothetical protein